MFKWFMAKTLISKIIITTSTVVIIGGATAGTIIVVPKVKNNIEEKRIQQEMQQDLEQVDIILNKEEIELPYKGSVNTHLDNGEQEEMIALGISAEPQEGDYIVTDYSKFEKYVETYKGGELSITGSININEIGTYKVIYTVTSEKGNAKNKELIVKVIDLMRPELYIDKDKIEIDIGTEVNILEDITAEDNVDGDITAKIQTEGTVDINTIGEYVITYKVQDTAGWKVEGTRTYIVSEPLKISVGATYKYGMDEFGRTADFKFTSNTNFELDYPVGMSAIVLKGTYKANGDTITLNVTYDTNYTEFNQFDGSKSGFKQYTTKATIIDKNTIKFTNSNGNTFTYKK